MDAIVYDKVGKEAEKVREALYGIYPQETITDAAIASFDDGADGIPVKALTVGIEPVQSGTGDPSPDNVRPISGWTGAEIEQRGKNLLNPGSVITRSGNIKPQVTESGYVLTVDVTGSSRFFGFKIPVKKGETYAIKMASDVTNLDGAYVYFDDSDNEYLDVYRGSKRTIVITWPITATGNYMYITFEVKNNAHQVQITKLQVAVGGTASDDTWSPYTGNQISVTFPSSAGTVYGATMTLNPDRTGMLVVERAMVDLGMLTWGYNTNQMSMVSLDLTSTVGDGAKVLCSAYKTVTNLQTASWEAEDKAVAINKASCTTSGNFTIGALVVKDTEYTDAATFKTAMSGVQLVYELASPQTYQLTAEQVSGILSTLYGQNNIWADTGNIKKLTYRADLGKYIDSHITTAVANALNA